MKTTDACRGCEDDFYNDRNPLGVKRCWHVDTAQIVTKYRIGTWTTPTTPGAFTRVRVPGCYRKKGQHYCEKLPDFVKPKDVRRERSASG